MKLPANNWARRLFYHSSQTITKLLCLSALLITYSLACAQQTDKIKISGTVKDTAGTGIPGVSVYLSDNRSVGTATDESGKFMLEVTPGARITLSVMLQAQAMYRAP